ncbi:class C beta-lactamase [Pseudomonas sp. LJDD11]|uniref:class C beta-lactamase n=1 Tax=Pseudomonas sp. LJDD11 TaxID=2931984 RepID=UPI00359C327E
MTMNRTITLTAVTLALLGSPAAWSQTTDSQARDLLIEQAARQVMQQNGIAGMAIAVTDHGVQRFYNFGVAAKDTGAPVTSDTLFELGSISKTFTATLATWAQAQGKLRLDAPIDSYLPALHDSRLGKVAVLHLATHTAGGFPLQVPDRVQDEQQLMAYFKAWQPQYLPGTHRSYANPSIGLLGVIAAKSLGLPFDQAMQQGLLPALGLSATWIKVPADKQSLYAQGYDRQDQPVRLNPGILADQAYGVKSSSADLIRFVEANIASHPPTSPLQEALRATHTGYFSFGPAIQALAWESYPPQADLSALLAGNSNDMALKTQPAQALRPPVPPAPGSWLNKTGSTNGFGGYVAFMADREWGVVILANRNYPNPERVRLAQTILNAADTPLVR